MKTTKILSLATCFVLFISINTNEKSIKKEIKYTGFDFTGLRDSVEKYPMVGTYNHGTKLWGYIR